jgi:hypothetical protein
MALPTLYQLASSFAANLSGFFGKAVTFTVVSVGATTATVSFIGAGGTPVITSDFSGAEYLGVPGPELAGGLPFLALAAAYGAYRYVRNARAQKLA